MGRRASAELASNPPTPQPCGSRVGRLAEQLAKIINLPPDERVKAFRLLVALLGVADDRRRRRFCADGCGHAWHHLKTGAGTETATT